MLAVLAARGNKKWIVPSLQVTKSDFIIGFVGFRVLTVCLIDQFSWNSILCVETWKVGIIIMKSHSYFQCIWSLPPTFQISTWNLKIKPDSVTSSDGTIHLFYFCELPLCWRDVYLASGYKLAWDAFIIVFIWVWIIVIRKQWAVKWIDFLYQHKIGLSKWAVM